MLIFSSWIFPVICLTFTSFVCVRCVVVRLKVHVSCSVVLPLLGLDLLRVCLFCVVVVDVESEILLSLVTAPRKTRANSGITINGKFPNLQYDTLHTNEVPTCMTDK